MIESILSIDKINKRHLFAFVLGIVYTLIGAITAYTLFKDFVSLSTLFFTTLLLVPTLMSYLNREESIESKVGLKHFFANHKDIVEVYFYLFLGVFVMYLVLGAISGSSDYNVLEYQQDFLARSGISAEVVESIPEASLSAVVNILNKNLLVTVVAFLLSVAYGAGAIFLIMFNASIFATFIITIAGYITQSVPRTAMIVLVFLIHVVPEILGFLLAAIAGGVISKALLNEKFGSSQFSNVIKDATVLFLIAVGLIVLAAFLEVYVTRSLFAMLV